MNWDSLIYAGTAAAAAGFSTALAVFIELKISETAAYLSGRERRKEEQRIREEEQKLRKGEQKALEEKIFVIKKEIIAFWPDGVREWAEGDVLPGTAGGRTAPLKGRTD